MSVRQFCEASRGRDRPLSAKSAFMLACILMMETGDNQQETADIVRALYGTIDCPDWQAASRAWQACREQGDGLQLVRGSMDTHQADCAIANLAEVALAGGTLTGRSRDLLYRLADILNASPGFVDQALTVISRKNDRDLFSASSATGTTDRLGWIRRLSGDAFH